MVDAPIWPSSISPTTYLGGTPGTMSPYGPPTQPLTFSPTAYASQPARPVTPTPPSPATATTYAPSPIVSPLAGNEPSIAAHGNITTALLNAGATPHEAVTLTAISGAESSFGRSPISPPNKNGSRDYGYFQINNAAHPQMGGAAVASMPLDKQAALALSIARSREGFGAWTTYKTGAYQKYLGSSGNAAAPPVSAAPAAPAATGARTPFLQAAQSGDVGAALAALNASDASGKGPLDPLSSALGASPPKAPSIPASPTIQPSYDPRMAQLAAQAPQAFSLALKASQQPLTWSAAPPGSRAPPGVTLNTSGDSYGG